MKKQKTKTNTKIVPIRFTEKNIKIFTVIGYLDKRDGKIKSQKYSFNKMINDIVSKLFDDGLGEMSGDKLRKKVKVLMMQDLNKQQKELTKKMHEVANL